MIAEIIIGRSTQKSPVSAFLKLGHPAWSLVGWLGITTGFVILSYYSVVAGWTIHYFFQSLSWSFNGFTPDTAASLGDQFTQFVGNSGTQIGYHGLFMALSILVVVFGVESGIERLTKILMPILFLILIGMLINAAFTPGFSRAIGYLFTPTQVRPGTVLEAVGQAFFSLSLGMGAIITYGSYMSKKESIPRAAGLVCAMDTFIALIASVIMFSIVFTAMGNQAWPEEFASTGILFTTLPRMFYNLPGGVVLSPLFFLLVAFAALTSTISLLEVVVAYFIDHLKWPRIRATLIVGLTIFLFGILSALSFGGSETISGFNPFHGRTTGVFDTLDYLATNWFLPVGGIFIAIFVGWILKPDLTREELELGGRRFQLIHVWQFLVRFVAPIAVGWIIYSVIFLGKTYN